MGNSWKENNHRLYMIAADEQNATNILSFTLEPSPHTTPLGSLAGSFGTAGSVGTYGTFLSGCVGTLACVLCIGTAVGEETQNL